MSTPAGGEAQALTPTAIATTLRQAGCVFAEEEAELLISAATTPTELAAMVEQRVEGFPLEHVVGWAEFCGLRIQLDPGVFVPRGRTELMVREAIALGRPGAVVVDLCCGSGAVGLALTHAHPEVQLYAVDIDPVAVRCATRNLQACGGRVFAGDLFEPLPETLLGRVDILLANTPYVPTDAIAMMPREARLHEARVALDGGADGLDVQRRVATAAPRWLAPGGHLLVETSAGQADQAVRIFSGSGLSARLVTSTELDARVVLGRNH